MTKAFCAAAFVLAVCPAAFAGSVLLPNGSFQNDGPGNGFGLPISNWTVSAAVPSNGLPANQASGLFGSFAAFNTPPNGTIFAILTNLGSGTTSLTSGASGVNFFVSDRLLAFQYGYLTNDPPGGGSRDTFRVQVQQFATATSTTVLNTLNFAASATQGTFTDASAGISPFTGNGNNPMATYKNSSGSAFNFVALDISQFFGTFARVSFIIDNAGPAAGTNGNGFGVSGIVLDNVLLTPEPSAIALFALGALGLGGLAWRRRYAMKPVAAK